MLPTFEFLGREVSFYGIFCLVGVGLAIVVALARSKVTLVPKQDIFFAALYAGIGLIVGGKVLYLITIIPEIGRMIPIFTENPKLILDYLAGGFVFYGGLGGVVAGLYVYCRQYKLRFLPLMDTCVVGVPLAHLFGRLGCFSAGCCYGCEYDGIGHIVFQHSSIAPNGVPLFPSQLVEAGCNLILFICLAVYGRRVRPTGRLTGVYLSAYAVIRFVLEFWRGDAERGVFLGISTSQLISILLLPIGLWLIFSKRFRRHELETGK